MEFYDNFPNAERDWQLDYEVLRDSVGSLVKRQRGVTVTFANGAKSTYAFDTKELRDHFIEEIGRSMPKATFEFVKREAIEVYADWALDTRP